MSAIASMRYVHPSTTSMTLRVLRANILPMLVSLITCHSFPVSYAMLAVAFLEDTCSQVHTIDTYMDAVSAITAAQLEMLLILVMDPSGCRNLDKGTEGQVPR